MARKQQYTVAQVIAALRKNKGMVYLSAKQLGCDPETINNYCKRYPTVQAAKEAQRGEFVDLAETRLWRSVHKGEAWGVTLVLKTLGKDRGYVERTQQEVSTNLDNLAQALALLRTLPDATLAQLETPDGPAPLGLPHETA